MTQRILQPGEIEALSATGIPEVLPPDATNVFARRAERLEQLARGSSLADYLLFIAQLARAQQRRIAAGGLPEPASAAQRLQAFQAQMPQLPARAASRPKGWQAVLRALLADLAGQPLPPPARAVVAALAARGDDWLDAQAAHLLAGQLELLELASAPLVAAALQVIWVAQAATLSAADVGPLSERGLCPVCGSHPVASIVRLGGEVAGYRYLHCALCSTEWHLVRAKCSQCDGTREIDYRAVEGGSDAVKGECCGECHSYLKLMNQEKVFDVDPVADDLATLALDLMLDEAGFARSGLNLMLFVPPA